MARINQNEKKLLSVLGIVVFLAANGVGYFLISGMMKNLDAQKTQLKSRLKDLNDVKTQAQEADEKESWMAAHFITYPDEEFRETYLDSLVNSDLTTGLDVELSKPTVLPTDTSGEFCVRSRFKVTVKGPWTDVYKFIYRLQKPEDFRFVPQISMVPKKAESDDSVQMVEVTVTIEKWWQRPDGVAQPPTNLLVENEQNGDGTGNNAGGGTIDTANPAPADSEKPAAPPAAPAGTPSAPEPAVPAPADNDSTKPNP